MMSNPQLQLSDSPETCLEHHSEIIQSFCISHQKLCCKVCQTIKHKACDAKDISDMAADIKNSHKLENLENLTKQLGKLRERYHEHLSKRASHELTIQKTHTNAMNDMMKLRESFDKLMTENEKQADTIKEEDFKQIETVSTTCNIVVEQIDKTNKHLDRLKEKNENESLFIAMHQAEGQLQSLEDNLKDLDNDDTVRKYTFEPDKKLQAMLKDLKALGDLQFYERRTPVYEKDINVKSTKDKDFEMHGLAVLPNNQLLTTDWHNKEVKLINPHKNKIISKIKLPGSPFDIATMTTNEVAVTQNSPNTIQMLNVSNNKLNLGRKIVVIGHCKGIAFNAEDQTFTVSFRNPSKVNIINTAGMVIRCIEKDSKGVELFDRPYHVALSPDGSGIYVSDWYKQSVIFITLSGEVKAVYKDIKLDAPVGIHVDKSGVLYVVGRNSNTMHQIDPVSGEFKLLLDQKDGLDQPRAICYCGVENKLYVGLQYSHVVKVYNMKKK